MATPERGTPAAVEKVSMRELLAACAAASAVSTPPREREETRERDRETTGPAGAPAVPGYEERGDEAA
jgi:hypothetical protein